MSGRKWYMKVPISFCSQLLHVFPTVQFLYLTSNFSIPTPVSPFLLYHLKHPIIKHLYSRLLNFGDIGG